MNAENAHRDDCLVKVLHQVAERLSHGWGKRGLFVEQPLCLLPQTIKAFGEAAIDLRVSALNIIIEVKSGGSVREHPVTVTQETADNRRMWGGQLSRFFPTALRIDLPNDDGGYNDGDRANRLKPSGYGRRAQDLR